MKQLSIRNTFGGLIWQVYHVKNQTEVDLLVDTATRNGFLSHSVENEIDNEETWPGWRDTEMWINRISSITMKPDFTTAGQAQ